MKTPEQYFVEDVRLPDVTDPGRTLTGAEEAFLDKYLGVDREKVLAQARRLDPRGDDSVAGFSAAGDAGVQEHSDENMRNQKDIRLVSFMLMGREFACPSP